MSLVPRVRKPSSSPGRRSTPWLLAASALAALSASPVQAQSLQELYDAAHGYDATYLAAKALADSAQYRVEQARALRRPQVGAQLSVGRSSSDTPAADNFTRSAVGALNASQSLFNRANDATIAQAEKSLEASAADLQLAEQDLIVRLATAYFDVLAAQDALGAAQANKKAISEQLASAKRNFEVGTTTITDTREAQARFDLATAQEIVADNDLRTKRIALDVLVGRAGVAPKGLATPVKLPAPLPADVDQWVSQSEASPNVRKAALSLDVARLETDKARAQGLPTVGVSGSLSDGYAKSRGYQSGFAFRSNGNANTSNVAVTMNVPLFAGFAIQNRIKETLVLEEQSRNNLEATRRIVAQATRQTYFGVQSLQAQVGALEAAESSSQLALEATQLGYRVGVRVNLDVLNAQTQLFTTRRDLSRARYDVLLNGLKLRQAAGTLQPGDVSGVNQWLSR